jgi:hypothetical protein
VPLVAATADGNVIQLLLVLRGTYGSMQLRDGDPKGWENCCKPIQRGRGQGIVYGICQQPAGHSCQ